MMYQDKTYIMCVDSILGHESEVEFRPVMVTESDQYAADGTKMEDSIAGHYYDEVTEDFYESERGRRWLNFLDCLDYRNNIFPVTGTDNIHLMMGFYRGIIISVPAGNLPKKSMSPVQKYVWYRNNSPIRTDLR